MLYVCRRGGLNEYWVVDTDDGVEELVKYSTLTSYIGETDIEILGVSTAATNLLSMNFRVVSSVHVHQDEAYLTPLQVKLKTMCHVDIKVYKSMVTDMTWDGFSIQTPVTVRLSDFGRSIAPRILSDNIVSGSHKVTIVLDDKITFAPEAFMTQSIMHDIGVGGFGAKFDMRELSDDRAAGLVYNSLYMSMMGGNGLFKSVIDKESRMNEMARRLNLVV